jgi:hypothetical protein
MTTACKVIVHAKERGTGRPIDVVLDADDTPGNDLTDPSGSSDIILSSDKPCDIVQVLFTAGADACTAVEVFANGNTTGKQLVRDGNVTGSVNPQVSYVQPIGVKAGTKLTFIQRA